jgi:enoyl-CoA hydratase/carnithine racemase
VPDLLRKVFAVGVWGRVGPVRQVVPVAELLAAAAELAKVILRAPADALRFAKERLTASAGYDFEASLAEEHDRAHREGRAQWSRNPGRCRATMVLGCTVELP